MKFVIETYARDGGHLALALPLGALVSDAGVSADESERRAIIGAVHNYFNRKERTTVAPPEEHPADTWARGTVTGRLDCSKPNLSTVTAKVAVDQTTIERLLREASAGGRYARFRMTYRDAGDKITHRTFTLNGLEQGSGRLIVQAWDEGKEEPRTFLTDRIERLEAIDA